MPLPETALDYYSQVKPSWQGPEIDPELLDAAARLEQQSAAQSPTVVLSSRNQPQAAVAAQPAPAGYGNQIKADGDRVLFPYDAYEEKKEFVKKSRSDADVVINRELVKLAGQTKETYDAWKNYYTALKDQKFPEVPKFLEENPQVYKLQTEIQESVIKRNKYLSQLASYANQADIDKRNPGESEKDWKERMISTLVGQLKIYNTALAGTSDALSNQERRDIAMTLPILNIDPARLNKMAGDVIGGNVRAFRQQLLNLHDLLLNEVNDGFNTLAGQTSPKYATKALGSEQYYPLVPNPNDKNRVIPRVTEDAPPEVIKGTMSLERALFQRKAAFEEEKQKDITKAKDAMRRGASFEEVNKMIRQKYGMDLPK